jgi:serralysin
MSRRLWVLICLSAVVLLGAGNAHGYIATDRWNRTATNANTGGQGSPITLTWGFAPDGTTIPASTSSNLISFLDTNFGVGPGGDNLSQRPWFTYFAESAARISSLSGVTFVYEHNDDGRSFSSSSSAQGVLGVRGDIRIGGKSYGSGSNILASNFYPDYGDMMINTDKGSYFKQATNNHRQFRNTIMHELMHGLGIKHIVSNDANFLIEPAIGTSFDGPQLDDLLAIQRLYGDVYEKGGGNNTYSVATNLGSLTPTQPIAIGTGGNSTTIAEGQLDFLSIDDNSDTDFFSFSLDDRLDLRLRLAPRGTTYNIAPQADPPATQNPLNSRALSNLSLALFDTNGSSLLGSADNNPIGLGEQILHQLLPGTYYARVRGAQNDVQLYGLNFDAFLPLPGSLLWVGNLSADWTVGTANFASGGTPAAFYDLDNAAFNDTSTVRVVNLPDSITAGDIQVTTSHSYTFIGPGGIIANSLTADGPGVVELASSGISDPGHTQVLAGTLRLSGSGIVAGEVQVAHDATLEFGGDFHFQSSARLSGDGLVVGDIEMPGTIAPGDSIGTLSFADDLSLFQMSRLEIELGAAEQELSNDSLAVTGFAVLDGIMEVVLMAGQFPGLNTTFEVLRAEAGIFGEFDEIVLPELSAELAWNVIYSNFALLLEVVDANIVVLPGDFNQDGQVDAADYVVWRKNMGSPAEYDEWRTHFGQSSGSAGGGGSNVDSSGMAPEPGSLVLTVLGCIMGLVARRR